MSEFREFLTDLSRRLAAAPRAAADYTRRRGEVSDQLHRTLATMKEIETRTAGEVAAERSSDGKMVYPNDAARSAEIARRLQTNQDYQKLRQEADRLRGQLREYEVQAEEIGRRHKSDCHIMSLITALLNAGMKEEVETVLAAYARELGKSETRTQEQLEQQKEEQQQQPQQEMAEGIFSVLEARVNEKGVVRAWCEGPQGKVALYAKNGAGKTLQAAIGKRVKARYRQVDKGLFAVEVMVL